MRNWKEKLVRLMAGRYGVDALGKFILYVAVGCMVINLFFRNGVLSGLSLAFLLLCYFRMFSRNIEKRYEENIKYWNLRTRMMQMFKRDKTHRIYRCPGCRQKIRIPRGKGKIEISCPKCRTTFIRRS